MAIVIDIDGLRARRGITENALCTALGMSAADIQALTSGEAIAVRLATLDSLCRILDCEPGDIVRRIPDEDARSLPATHTGCKWLGGAACPHNNGQMAKNSPAQEAGARRVKKAAPRTVLVTGLVLLGLAVAAGLVGWSGYQDHSKLTGHVVPITVAWGGERQVVTTGTLEAGTEYAICAGPRITAKNVDVIAGVKAGKPQVTAEARLPLTAVPLDGDLGEPVTIGRTTCRPSVVFTPPTSERYTIVFSAHPITSWATGVAIADYGIFPGIKPANTKMIQGFLAAAACGLLGAGLTIGGGWWLHQRRDLERWLRSNAASGAARTKAPAR